MAAHHLRQRTRHTAAALLNSAVEAVGKVDFAQYGMR
jgi:hypothetical protein